MIKKPKRVLVPKSFSLEEKDSEWFIQKCYDENLSPSQVIRKRIREMKEKNILW